jgi:hypothetical protein
MLLALTPFKIISSYLSIKELTEFHQLEGILEDLHEFDSHDKWAAFGIFNLFSRSLQHTN